MKFVVFVAMFAFVAVQLSHSAPAPDDEKEAAAPTAVAAEAAPQNAPEEKSAHPEAVAGVAETTAAETHAEEKKS